VHIDKSRVEKEFTIQVTAARDAYCL